MNDTLRYDLVQPIENKKSGKTYWHKIGSMYGNGEGKFDIILNSLPLQSYDEQYGLQLRIKAFPPKNDQQPRQAPKSNDFNDDVPW